jgi:hypothetical protein
MVFAAVFLQFLHGTLYVEIHKAEELPGDPTLVPVRTSSRFRTRPSLCLGGDLVYEPCILIIVWVARLTDHHR